MREPVVHHEDPELDYNIWGNDYLQYKGVFFTGTLFYDDTNPVSYTEYKDGNRDGERIVYYKNGQLAEKNIYRNGRFISSQEWHENGQLKYSDGNLYAPEGKVIQIEGSWLYPNGAKRNDSKDRIDFLYSSKGELAIKTISGYREKNTCYDKVLSECYHELLINYYPDFDKDFCDVENKIWGWAAKKYWWNRRKGMEIYQNLAKHPNQNIAKKAEEILEQINKKEFRARDHFKNYRNRTILR